MASNGKEDRGKPRPKYVWDTKKLAWVEIKEAAPSEEVAPEPLKEEIQAEVKEKLAEEEAPAEEEIEEEAASAEPVPAWTVPAVETPAYRGAWIRLLGFVIDFIIFSIIYYIIVKALGAGVSTDDVESTRSTIVLAITIGVVFVYFFGLWGWRGQSIGKMVIGARVVKMDGSPVGFVRAFLRAFVFLAYFFIASFAATYVIGILAFFVLLVVFLIIAFSRKKRGIHDLIAGTCVVSSRVPWPQAEVFESVDTSEGVETSESTEPEADKQG